MAFDRVSLAGASVTFALMGAIAAVYGPLLGTIGHRYGVTLPVAGLTLTVHFVGALCGVLSAMSLVRRIQGRHLVGSALLVMGVGAALIAVVSSWLLFLFGVAVLGVGFGGLTLSVNHLLARTKGGGRASRLSVVNATYGVGAIAGPLLVDWLTPARFKDLFAGFAVAAAALSLSMRGVSAPPTGRRASPATPGPRAARLLGVDRPRLLGVFFVGYVLYVSVETSTSGWLAAQLHGSRYSVAVGSLVTAGFWGGMAVGRLLAAPLHRRVSERSFVLGGLATGIVLTLCASSARVALVSYPIDGLALAAVFPMGLAWYTLVEERSGNGVLFLLLGTEAGGVLGPGLESLAVSSFGLHAVPFVIAALACADLVVFARAAVVTSRSAGRGDADVHEEPPGR